MGELLFPRDLSILCVLLTISSGSSGRGLMPGLISSLTSVGKNPTVEVHMKEAGKHFLHHHRPELEFSAWTSLFLDSFCAAILYLCLEKQQSWSSFSPTRVGAGRMLVKERKHTEHHYQDID